MNKKHLLHILAAALLVLLLVAAGLVSIYYAQLPQHLSQHETILVGQSHFTPGSQTAMRVIVRDSKDGSPLENAQIEVKMQPQAGGTAARLFQGQTDASGTASISFRVPEDAAREQNLIIETTSQLGSDKIERSVTVEREYRVLLTTDKPIYQPGQIIHIRALALSTFDRSAAGSQPLEIVIADGKGNKVFRQPLTTSTYGVASTDFQLASEVNTGDYKITAVLGSTTSEKTVSVEHYSLPKFDLEITTDRTYYQPGQHVSGTLKAAYFYGKPVAGSKVLIEGFTYDVQKVQALSAEGQTGPDGSYLFEFDLPSYIAGSEFDSGMGRFYLQVSVTDQTGHSESKNISLPVSGSALVIDVVPESGILRPGLDNILYVLSRYPDGTPAECDLSLNFMHDNQSVNAATGPYGLAEVHYTPRDAYQQIQVQAQDRQGNTGSSTITFDGSWQEEQVLLRPDQPVYQVGQTMKLTILTSQQKGSAYLDVVRDGQTISTRTVSITGGQGEALVDLSPDLVGTLELHAYKILSSGTIARDTRIVVVSQAEDLNIQVQPGQETYLPGDTARLDLQVNGADGQGVQSAVGLTVVDEAVFALSESDPGFARLYFLLEKEILQPRYDLHGYNISDLTRGLPESDPRLQGAVSGAAQASLSEAVKDVNVRSSQVFSLTANSHQDNLNRAYKLREQAFDRIQTGLFLLFLLLPAVMVVLTVIDLLRTRRLWLSLSLVLAFAASLLLFMWIVPSPYGSYSWGGYLRLSGWFQWLSYDARIVLLVAVLTIPAAYITLVVIAIRRKDGLLGWTLGLMAASLAAFFLMFIISNYTNASFNDWMAFTGQMVLLLAPLAFILRFAGEVVRDRSHFGAGKILMLLAMLPLTLGILITSPIALASQAQRTFNTIGSPLMAQGSGVQDLAFAGGKQEEAVPQAAAADKETSQPTAQAPRLRQYFPETMLWLPDAETDALGRLSLDIPVADSITTWRITALASSQNGQLGSATAPLTVFQDFFIDLDLPLNLTVDDEVSIPVGIFNYLPEGQTVRLELEPQDWFELQGETSQEIQIAANDIGVTYFRIRVTGFGQQPFKVTAWGTRMSDAIQKEVRVYPNGKEIHFTASDRLTPDSPVKQAISFPPAIIAGTQRLTVKIYPGILSQVVEGLDSILRMPNGCFEQTSSTTYPNILVLDYLNTTNQVAPQVQMKAEEYINLGYQRLTTFEVQSSGGFSLFGDAPADRMLTAYGLQEFADMSRVQEVDPALIQRAAQWLFSQQDSDGSWENDRGLVHENTWSSLGNDRLPVTAYITWSLIEAGFVNDTHTRNGLSYVREHQAEAEDTYVLALVANTLVAADHQTGEITPATGAVLDRLAGLARQDGQGYSWSSGVATFMGSEGQTGSIETTALAALALMRAESHTDVANAALLYLIRQKDSFGTWHSTQATVLTLKALLQSVRGAESNQAEVTITLNGGQAKTLQVTPENYDVVQMVTFEDLNPGQENTLEIRAAGQGSLMYQATGSYFLPWEALSQYPELVPAGEAVKINVNYDRTELAVNDSVTVNVSVSLTESGATAESALIDLGIPPGFSVQTEDLQALVERFNDIPSDYAFPTIERYELTGRQILVYVRNLSSGSPLEFSFRLKARFPLSVLTPSSGAYDYYNPDVSGEVPPQKIVVNP